MNDLSQNKIRNAANNAVLMLASRWMMVLTPPVLGALAWLYYELGSEQRAEIISSVNNMDARVRLLEEIVQHQGVELQDHESRLVFGKVTMETGQTVLQSNLDKITQQLDNLAGKVTITNNNVIALQTMLNERVPARQTMNGGVQ